MPNNNPANRFPVRRGLVLTRLRRTFRLGLRSLWLHRLRSLLTVLGIVFGVCSVIAMLAIGEPTPEIDDDPPAMLRNMQLVPRVTGSSMMRWWWRVWR